LKLKIFFFIEFYWNCGWGNVKEEIGAKAVDGFIKDLYE
jgi:hypothetical protein